MELYDVMDITLTSHKAHLRAHPPVAMCCGFFEGDTMSETSNSYARQTSWRNDGGFRGNPFDPAVQPELFRGVLGRRFFAFLIDLVVLGVPILLGVIFIALFGLL